MTSHNVENTQAFPITPRGIRDAISFWISTPYRSSARLGVQVTHYQSALPIRLFNRGDGNLHGYSGIERHHIGRPLILICAQSPLQKKRGTNTN